MAFAATLVLLALMLFYVQGALDRRLYNVGLNWEACGQITGGEIICGEESSIGALVAPESLRVGIRSWAP